VAGQGGAVRRHGSVLGCRIEDHADAGISIVAVSTDSAEGLQKTLAKSSPGSPFAFPLVSNERLDVFKAYRAFDDFEQMPLHGTFLIDGDGLVRWQDISYEPFKETGFLLGESKRLLNQSLKPGLTHLQAAGRARL
jgi:alkyl hydroperoxide reductase subunit AhpC